MTEAEQAAQAAPSRPLDRSTCPGVSPAIEALTQGWGWDGTLDPTQVAKVLDGASSVVNAMAQGERYAVGLSGQMATAQTDLLGQAVTITTAALADTRLSVSERLAVTIGMAMHEAGHARLTLPMSKAVERWSRAPERYPWRATAARLSNIAEDERLERRTGQRWGAYAEAFRLTMWWVSQRYPAQAVTRLPETRAEAVNFGLAAIRYGSLTQWGADAGIAAERAWWTAWAERMTDSDRPKDHMAGIEAAVAHIAHLPTEKPEPEAPQMPGDPGQGDASDEGGEPGEQGEQGAPGESDPTEGDQSEPGDQSGDGEAADGEGDDEQGDEPGEGAGAEGESEGDESEGEADGEGSPTDAPAEAEGEGQGDGEAEGQTDQAQTDTEGKGEQAAAEGTESEAEGEGEGEYSQRSEPGAEAESSIPERGGQDVSYGPLADAEGPTPTDSSEGLQQDADALSQPLPLEPTETATSDDRDRDQMIGSVLRDSARVLSTEQIEVTHPPIPVGDKYYDHHAQTQTQTATIARTEGDGFTEGLEPGVQAALRSAFTSRRRDRSNRTVSRSGRLSGRRAHRVVAGMDNVFTRRNAPSPDRLDLHLLVDASGSMAGGSGQYKSTGRGWRTKPITRLEVASTLVANITEALAHLPYVRVHVWAHNTAGSGARLWDVLDTRRGETAKRVRTITSAGANRDGTVVRALGERIIRERSNREQSVLVVFSDGAPCESVSWVKSAAHTLRSQGVGVLSVAVTGGLTETQQACYDADSVIVWTGDWDQMGRDIARHMGQLA